MVVWEAPTLARLVAIVGVRIVISDTKAKSKFGGNRTARHRLFFVAQSRAESVSNAFRFREAGQHDFGLFGIHRVQLRRLLQIAFRRRAIT
jgi:predicted FMN-binding regulatory protein PaiB